MSEEHCPICVRPASAPYRRCDARGRIVEGCVARHHDGHLIGESLHWHNRPEAKKIRRALAVGRTGKRHRYESKGD